ncbi:karyopherin [Neophaeococcomyces mojaviensis]|uniref:Karyopherin n=1 Tax=Neophaeococcomyces mojaviensis TaxID=3383035 RepID=A0ACC3A5L5_9EURO|nr:karyopherin [Knufia sp. JES_112]
MAQANGVNGYTGSSSIANLDVSTIIQALEVVHNSASNNDNRRQASSYLEDLKQQSGIAEAGYTLASDTSQQPLVRHYGLSLLEHIVKHQSFALNEQSSAGLRQLVLQLSLTLENTPQPFIRNKIAALWVELTKRSWALDWFDLDEALQQLWTKSDIGKEFVLTVLENLSEDVFVREDSTAVLRDKDLNNAVVEIFTPSANYAGGLKIGGQRYHLRRGEEGWTSRIVALLNQCLQQGSKDKTVSRLCVAVLGTLRSVFTWIMTPAIVGANAMMAVCDALLHPDTDVILAAVDTLLAFYSRTRLEEVEVQALVHPLCHPNSAGVLEQVYGNSIVGPEDMLNPRYVISKKLAELLYHLTSWLTQYEPPKDTDTVPFLKLLVNVARHDSLIVSIAAIHSCDKLLQSSWRRTESVQACIQPMLQMAMQRIIAYDMLPRAEDEPAVMFVNEEIELYPERQGFYANYRRFCFSIIEAVSYVFLQDALEFILSAVDGELAEVTRIDQAEDMIHYTRLSANMLRADAMYSVIDGAFKGIDRWCHSNQQSDEQQTLIKRNELLGRVKEWSTRTLEQHRFRDPCITLRQIKTAVETSSRTLKSDTEFAFSVLQHIVTSFQTPPIDNTALSDAQSELQSYATGELRRLCSEHATYFVTFYDQLETKLEQITASNADPKVQMDLRSILLLLIEHAEGIDRAVRQERLRSFIEPLASAWQQREPELSTFDTYIRSQAFDQVGPFTARERANEQADWAVVALSSDAQPIQNAMTQAFQRLPLRDTRVLLSTSTDRLREGSETHAMVCEIWLPLLLPIVSNVLRLISYNHQLHDPSSWPNITSDQHTTIQRILRDRYWQSGISGGSMHDFHAHVKATKSTLEGFASSVRGRIRVNLENCYSIIHTLGRLGSHFYGINELPQMISTALLVSSSHLSPHHFGQLLSMLPKLIGECPAEDRGHFLTPVLSELLRQIDSKCTPEWDKIAQRASSSTSTQDQQEHDLAANGDLSDEMRDESVLRQMTYKAVNMVTLWIDPNRELKLSGSKRVVNHLSSSASMRDFILSSPTILEPLLLFCTHAISYKDTKSCATIVSSLHRFVAAFSTEVHLQGADAMAVREFISLEMMKASINSLNDGYFADYHGNVAILIAEIWLSFGLPAHIAATETSPAINRPAWTDTPRNVLLSIPGIDPAKVDRAARDLTDLGLAGSGRKFKAIILRLLENVRGVRVSELGKIDNKAERSGLLEKYKQRDALGMQGVEDEGRRNGESDGVDLGGVADMFA